MDGSVVKELINDDGEDNGKLLVLSFLVSGRENYDFLLVMLLQFQKGRSERLTRALRFVLSSISTNKFNFRFYISKYLTINKPSNF